MKHAPLLFILIVASCSAPSVPNHGEVEWLSIERDLQERLITTPDSAVIDIPAGFYMFTKSLSLDGKKSITLRGAGIDQTVLSFASQEEGAEGIRISNGVNIILEDFTVEDAKGDNIKVTDTRGITLRRVKSQWLGEPKAENGAYAFYPVLSKGVLVENCIAIGSSDAGIYVGQSDSVIIRGNEAYYNVAGIESENSRWVEIYDNYAHDNTGGILVFDLPGLTQAGHSTRVFKNRVIENNFSNFAPEGNIVATVPPGTGLMLLATRKVEISDNLIKDNRTVGLAIASYDLVEALGTGEGSQLDENIETAENDTLYNPYPNLINVHHNEFANSYLIPTMENDFGYLFLMKFPFSTPDIVWDGISPDRTALQMCFSENGIYKFADLDAANEFENLTTEKTSFECFGIVVEPVF